ncbi:MAG TPA: helix-turn-helix domain-containing protein [Mucilaginibacter sp.]|jgi:excisionase family DNA binding protein
MEKLYTVSRSEILELVAEGVRLAFSQLPEKSKQDNLNPTGTRQEVAEYLKISLSKLDTLTRTGELKSFKLGGRQVRYKWSEISSYLTERG